MDHLADAQSQADVGRYLEHDENNDSLNENLEGVDIQEKTADEDEDNASPREILEEVGMEDMTMDEDGRHDCDNGKPVVGKLFDTSDDAYLFYNHYAMTKGFGTRIHWNCKSRTTRQITKRRYVCNKEGKKSLSDKRDIGKEVQRRRETRTGCMAMMEVALTDSGKWVVAKFIEGHNHVFTTPSKVMKHRSHSKFHRSDACKALMSELSQTGLRPSQITKAMNVVSGSHEASISQKNVSNYLQTERKNNVGQECYRIIKHFQEKAMTDGSHYFAMDLAKDGSLRSVFWADGRSRSSYLQFGDVVIFDVTYRTNKFKMPFAPFIGVNHHRQSIIFGAALLEDETEGTFVWLFEQFLKCMFNRPPVAIITDQDGAMRNAIKKVFPSTRHRFCAWHISKHVIEHLQSLRSRYDDFHEAYTKWVKSKTIEEFEIGWGALNEKYAIESNSWLVNMYDLRHHWVKAYLKDTFFAGMTTSGRSESIHAFFDGYVNANTMLNDFVSQYDRAVKSRRDAEEDEDFRTMNSKAVLISSHPIEEQAGKWYTRSLFELFKKEWKDSFLHCSHEKLSKKNSVSKYIVGLRSQDKSKWKIVQYDSSGDISLTCACAKFETEGILCKHILFIMKKKELEKILERYILCRWTIDTRHQVGRIGCGIIDCTENGVTPLTLWSIRAKFYKALEDARNSPTDIQELDSLLSSFLENLAIKKNTNRAVLNEISSQVDSNVRISQVEDMPQISIRDPIAPVRTKGRPRIASRQKLGLELAEEIKKQRTCGFCGEKGHYRTGCQKRKMTDREGGSSTPI